MREERIQHAGSVSSLAQSHSSSRMSPSCSPFHRSIDQSINHPTAIHQSDAARSTSLSDRALQSKSATTSVRSQPASHGYRDA